MLIVSFQFMYYWESGVFQQNVNTVLIHFETVLIKIKMYTIIKENVYFQLPFDHLFAAICINLICIQFYHLKGYPTGIVSRIA